MGFGFAERAAAIGALALLMAGAAAVPAQADAGGQPSSHVRVCGPPAKGMVACDIIRNDAKPAQPAASGPTAGSYGPADLHAAYALPTTGGSGRTIAIVDAYDDPTAAADLAVYRHQYGLPGCAGTPTKDAVGSCTFSKVGQSGRTSALPAANGGWAQEISLDLDMVSAICPDCNILLVEANSASMTDLGASVNTAVGLGAQVVSNSYGGSESSSDTTYDSKYFSHPGTVITASSGDNGYGVEYPAASSGVIAVGGTTLTFSGGVASETAWSGAGAGCSLYDAQPTAQGSADTGCAKRAVADVSAVADPSTGVAVYDSTRYRGKAGWMVFGGTSVASPVIAGVYGLAGSNPTDPSATLYGARGTAALRDVTSGSDGTCPVAQLCTARPGWDGPTGLGTPQGLTAF